MLTNNEKLSNICCNRDVGFLMAVSSFLSPIALLIFLVAAPPSPFNLHYIDSKCYSLERTEGYYKTLNEETRMLQDTTEMLHTDVKYLVINKVPPFKEYNVTLRFTKTNVIDKQAADCYLLDCSSSKCGDCGLHCIYNDKVIDYDNEKEYRHLLFTKPSYQEFYVSGAIFISSVVFFIFVVPVVTCGLFPYLLRRYSTSVSKLQIIELGKG